MSSSTQQEVHVSGAFGAQSIMFDSITATNPLEVVYREIVRNQVTEHTKSGERMLELNCGTGQDALFFASQGLFVHATDNSDGMLQEFNKKLLQEKLSSNVKLQKCSFNSLGEQIVERDFDHVFSNNGGLNCASDLRNVIKQVDEKVKPGGMVHFVMIAPFCLWEVLTLFKGKVKFALRRFTKKGVKSHLEGHYFMTYYYSASYIRKSFGNKYSTVQLKSIGCIIPPTYNDYFPAKYPAIFKTLKAAELKLNNFWPFNRVGDMYIISLKKSDN
jgi:ubiquinone/menaquinone biosynthesis C-methylase UbiE